MDIERHREDIVLSMTVKQAIKELKREPLINSIKETKGRVIIETNKITPERGGGEYYAGHFIIQITKKTKKHESNVYIRRKEGAKGDYGDGKMYHSHISPDRGDFTYGVCWGNVENMIFDLEKVGDVYWLGKLAISLIEDKE